MQTVKIINRDATWFLSHGDDAKANMSATHPSDPHSFLVTERMSGPAATCPNPRTILSLWIPDTNTPTLTSRSLPPDLSSKCSTSLSCIIYCPWWPCVVRLTLVPGCPSARHSMTMKTPGCYLISLRYLVMINSVSALCVNCHDCWLIQKWTGPGRGGQNVSRSANRPPVRPSRRRRHRLWCRYLSGEIGPIAPVPPAAGSGRLGARWTNTARLPGLEPRRPRRSAGTAPGAMSVPIPEAAEPTRARVRTGSLTNGRLCR